MTTRLSQLKERQVSRSPKVSIELVRLGDVHVVRIKVLSV